MTDRDQEALEWLERHATTPEGYPWSKAATHALTLARRGTELEPAGRRLEWRWPGDSAWSEGALLRTNEDTAHYASAMRTSGMEVRIRPLYAAPPEGGEHP